MIFPICLEKNEWEAIMRDKDISEGKYTIWDWYKEKWDKNHRKLIEEMNRSLFEF